MLAIGLLAVLLVGATDALAKRAVLELKDGRTVKGDLVDENPTMVTISIGGINASFSRSDIEQISYEKTLIDIYQEKRAELEADDYTGRYNLARWLYEQNDPEADQLAGRELQALLRVQPDNEQAKLLLNMVVDRIRQRQQGGDQARADQPRTDGSASDRPDGRPARPKLLTEQQCNLLKIYEIDLSTEPRIVVPRKTAQELLERYRTNDSLREYLGRNGLARFTSLPDYRQLQIMFECQARDLYDQVQIREEPAPLQYFRTQINPNLVVRYMLRYFKPQLQHIYLVDERPNRIEPAYTNFLMLHRGQLEGRPLIDRDQPRESMLIQWALPREDAQFPAPEVRGWRPYFTGLEDRRLAETEQWIRSMMFPAPRYPIQFTPPGSSEPRPEQPDEAPAESQPERPAEQPRDRESE
jgi:hypothetical protein